MTDATSESMRSRLALDRDIPSPPFATRPKAQAHTDADALEADSFDDLGPDRVRLTEALPPNVALLCVTSATWQDEPSFQLHFHYRGSVRSATKEHDLTKQRPAPAISLARLIAEQKGPQPPGDHSWRNAYTDVMNWWTGKDKLDRWMRELMAADGEPHLIVWDDTDYEIPWELFYHHRPDKPEASGWLGALIPVLRWTTVYSGVLPWHYSAQHYKCEGGLLVMEDPEMAVQPDDFSSYAIVKRFDAMRGLMVGLDHDCGAFGLLVIRCHGRYSHDTREFSLGGLSMNEYMEYSMAALRKHCALVLINACVSGRPVTDPRYPGAAPRSFSEIFLRFGAAGVIATVGDVDLNHSHDFAVRLLAEAGTADLNIAKELCKQRRIYAHKAQRKPGIPDTRTEDDFRLFFSSFMYIYFGHPGTTLRTQPSG